MFDLYTMVACSLTEIPDPDMERFWNLSNHTNVTCEIIDIELSIFSMNMA